LFQNKLPELIKVFASNVNLITFHQYSLVSLTITAV